MTMNRSRTAMIIVVAVIVVCGASFFAVRSLNKNTKTPTKVAVSAPTSADVASTQAPAPALTTELPEASDFLPTSAVATEATPDADDRFTTFPTEESTTAYSASFTTTADGTSANPWFATTPATGTAATSSLETTKTNYTSSQEAQQVINEAAKEDKGFLGYQFNPEGQYYFTTKDPWQRNFGFNELYDIGASFVVFYYDTFRCKFRYNDMDWMIQFWKGQYGFVFLGSEIGCYYKPLDRKAAHYDAVSDEDALYMTMTLYRKGEERATREYAKYWWCTAFIPGTLDSFRDRSELTMKARITMKDKTMLEAFLPSLEANGFKNNATYTVSGKDVYISWT